MDKKIFVLNGIEFEVNYDIRLKNLIQYFIIDNNPDIETKYKVLSNIKFENNINKYKTGKKISNSIFRNKDGIHYYINPNLLICFEFVSDTVIHSKLIIEQNISKLKFLKLFLRREVDSYFNFLYVQSFRHAILFPYFLLMNRKEKAVLSHGSALQIKNESMGILGFDGIGKSTIVKELSNKKIISDNFILLNQEKLFFVPDPLRIFDKKNTVLFGKSFQKLNYYIDSYDYKKLIFTFLGASYSTDETTKSFSELNSLFVDFLPEFYDFKKYTVAISLYSGYNSLYTNYNFEKKVIVVERAKIEDNQRMIDEYL